MGERGQEVVFGAVLRFGFAVAALILGGQRGRALLRHIAEGDDGADRSPLLVMHRRGTELDRKAGTVVAEERVRHFVTHAVAVQRGIERTTIDVAGGHTGESRMQKRMDFPARDLIGAAAHHPC